MATARNIINKMNGLESSTVFVLLFPGGCKHNKTLMYCSHESYKNKK